MSEPKAPHRFTLRVYYEDTDFSGRVYHANYLKFLERARTELLRGRGIDQAAWIAGRDGGPPLGFVVAVMTIAFRRPARMDDLLTVETAILSLGGASLELAQRILREGELLVDATARIAAVSRGRAARFPAEVVRALLT